MHRVGPSFVSLFPRAGQRSAALSNLSNLHGARRGRYWRARPSALPTLRGRRRPPLDATAHEGSPRVERNMGACTEPGLAPAPKGAEQLSGRGLCARTARRTRRMRREIGAPNSRHSPSGRCLAAAADARDARCKVPRAGDWRTHSQHSSWRTCCQQSPWPSYAHVASVRPSTSR